MAALFLAAKVEEQPKRLEHMAKVFHSLHNRDGSDIDVGSPVSCLLHVKYKNCTCTCMCK